MSKRYARRYYKVAPPVYEAMRGVADNNRGLPILGNKAKTCTALPPSEEKPVANDESGMLLVNLAYNDVKPADDAVMAPYIEQGLITELTKEQYNQLKPNEELL